MDVPSSVSEFVIASDSVCAFDLVDLSESHEIKAFQASEKVKLEPLDHKKIQISSKKEIGCGLFGWVGGTEVLRAALTLSDCYHATRGSHLIQMGHTAMTEILNTGCTILVLKRLRGGARMGNGVGGSYIPGQWECLVCGAETCCVTDVLSFVVPLVVVPGRPSPEQKVAMLRPLVLRWSLV